MGIRFEPSRRFSYEAGQFLSLIVPAPFAPPGSRGSRLRRAYSFSTPSEKGQAYELCVKHVQGGPGSSYLKSLEVGGTFKASAPYGDLFYRPREARNACFISTGTGVAPFRAMVLSEVFKRERPERVFSIFGARTESEIIYPGFFERQGLECVTAISQPTGAGAGHFKGRVTDYLRSLPADWPWHTTDFYLCGNGDMVADVRRILKEGHGVQDAAIQKEIYFSSSRPPRRQAA